MREQRTPTSLRGAESVPERERDDLSYATLAAKLRVSEGTIKNLIYRMRQRYRVLLRQEVRQTVADPAEVDEELRHLCGSLAASSA